MAQPPRSDLRPAAKTAVGELDVNPPAMPTTLHLATYSFPPESMRGAARPYRLIRYLPNKDSPR